MEAHTAYPCTPSIQHNGYHTSQARQAGPMRGPARYGELKRGGERKGKRKKSAMCGESNLAEVSLLRRRSSARQHFLQLLLLFRRKRCAQDLAPDVGKL